MKAYVMIAVMVACVSLLAIFQRQIRVVYHRMRFDSLMRPRSPRENVVVPQDWEKAKKHERELVKLGFYVEKEFILTRTDLKEPNVYQELGKEARKRFPDPKGWWSFQTPSSNTVAVITSPNKLAQWRIFIADFDRTGNKL